MPADSKPAPCTWETMDAAERNTMWTLFGAHDNRENALVYYRNLIWNSTKLNDNHRREVDVILKDLEGK